MVTDVSPHVVETTYVTDGPPPERPVKRVGFTQKLSKWDVKVSPFLYISPFFISFAIFGIYPILYNVYIATQNFTDFRTGGQGFVGLENFRWILGQSRFWNALGNTFSIWLLSSIPQLILALLIAAILDQNLRAKTFWRMAVLVPYVVLPIATSMIFAQLLGERGLLVPILGAGGIFGEQGIFGLNPAGNPWNNPFFQSRWVSHIAIATMVNFRWTGYNTLIFLAAMQAVPRELYEAAVVDGASRLRQFFSVTIPSIRPTMIFVILTMTIGGLQVFDEVVLFDPTGSGGSNRQFETVVLYLFNLGFGNWANQQLGRGAALAWIFALIILIFALINFFLTRAISGTGAAQAKVSRKTYKQLTREHKEAFARIQESRANGTYDPVADGLVPATYAAPLIGDDIEDEFEVAHARRHPSVRQDAEDLVDDETPAGYFEQRNMDY